MDAHGFEPLPVDDAPADVERALPGNASHAHHAHDDAASPASDSPRGSASGEPLLDAGTVTRRAAVLSVANLAWPVILSYFLEFLVAVVSLLFLGRLGDPAQLAAAGLAVMFANVTGFAVVLGLATAFDALLSQAFGAGNRRLAALWFQRGSVILAISAVPIAVLWFFVEDILSLMHQDPIIARLAGRYSRINALSLLPIMGVEALRRYLNNQRAVKPVMYAMFAANAVNVFAHWLLLYPLNLGFDGVPIAVTISYTFMFVVLAVYVKWRRMEITTMPWTRECLRGWGPFLRIAVPGVLQMMMGWWSFELSTFWASYLGTIPLAAQVIVMNTETLSFTIPLGIGVATSTVVGNSLGAGKYALSKTYAQMALALVNATSFVALVFWYLIRNKWTYLYTDDAAVVEASASILPIMGVLFVFDAFQGCCNSMLRGTGRQKIGAIIGFIGQYFIGQPIALLLTFVGHAGLPGLWWGLVSGMLFCSVCQTLVVVRTRWREQAILALRRAHVIGDTDTVGEDNNTVLTKDGQVTQRRAVSGDVDMGTMGGHGGVWVAPALGGKGGDNDDDEEEINNDGNHDSDALLEHGDIDEASLLEHAAKKKTRRQPPPPLRIGVVGAARLEGEQRGAARDALVKFLTDTVDKQPGVEVRVLALGEGGDCAVLADEAAGVVGVTATRVGEQRADARTANEAWREQGAFKARRELAMLMRKADWLVKLGADATVDKAYSAFAGPKWDLPLSQRPTSRAGRGGGGGSVGSASPSGSPALRPVSRLDADV